jgi:WXG100 family type VII secretion target
MTYIKYTPANLGQASGRVKATHGALRGDQESMSAFLRKTLGSTWQGGASETYQGVQTRWNQSCDHIHQILSNLGVALDGAAVNASGTETSLTRMWGG